MKTFKETMRQAGSVLCLGIAGSFAIASFSTGFVPNVHRTEIPTVEFGRAAPCSTCGAPAPVTLVAPDGTRWYLTEPGTVQELGLKYCPQGQSCKVIYN